MHCTICRHIMLSRSSQTVEDERGALLITMWGCPGCGGREEEIWISRRYQGTRPRRLRYAVTTAAPCAVPITPRAGRRTVRHAHAG